MAPPSMIPSAVPSAAPMQARTERKAIASVLFGAVSLVPFAGAVFGIPAIILGALARRDIDDAAGGASGVRLEGRALAASGIVSGLFGTGLSVVLVLWILGALFAPAAPDANAMNASANGKTPSVASSATPETNPEPAPSTSSSSTAPSTAGVHAYGSLEVIDLDSTRPLRTQLSEIVARAPRGRTIMIQTYAKSSSACMAVDAALPDHRMQRALANVTLVRVDLEEYRMELSTMKVETRTAPWFYKLDAKGEPVDSLSADAWDANIPENMAPALGKFVQKSAPRRRK